jgi:hypothetical protein
VLDFVSTSGYGNNPVYTATGNVVAFIGPTVTMAINSGDAVHMVANKALGTSLAGGANSLYIWACYRLSSATTPSSVGGGIFNLQTAQGTRVPIGIQWTFEGLATGTYEFGMCGYDGDADVDWNNNEYGYITAMRLRQ